MATKINTINKLTQIILFRFHCYDTKLQGNDQFDHVGNFKSLTKFH